MSPATRRSCSTGRILITPVIARAVVPDDGPASGLCDEPERSIPRRDRIIQWRLESAHPLTKGEQPFVAEYLVDVTLADVYEGRRAAILEWRTQIKQRTLQRRKRKELTDAASRGDSLRRVS
jgi:hypothetical protein